MLSLVPGLGAGLLFGLRSGLLTSLAITAIHAFLLLLYTNTGAGANTDFGIFEHIGLILSSGLVGQMTSLQHQLIQLKKTLLQAEKANQELQAFWQAKQELLGSWEDMQVSLLESEARFRQFFDNFPNPLFIEDLEGNILDVNPAACQLHHMSRERLIGKNAATLVPPEKRGEFIPSFEDYIKQGFNRIESESYTKEGISIPVEIQIREIEYNHQPAVLLHVRDISEKKRLQQSLAIAFDQALDAHRLKYDFLAKINQELNLPLTAIAENAEILQSENSLTSKQNPITDIHKNIEALQQTINLLLEQTRIEAGKVRLHTTTFSIRDLVDRVRFRTHLMSQHKALTVNFEISPDIPKMLSGDPVRIEQIFYNLISNAIKFTAEGLIEIKIYLVDKNWWAFKVSDTGPGIPVEAQNMIFESFNQAPSVNPEAPKGTGLGLSIVKEFTRMMGGQIRVESQVGEGASFIVMLPLIADSN